MRHRPMEKKEQQKLCALSMEIRHAQIYDPNCEYFTRRICVPQVENGQRQHAKPYLRSRP